MKITPAMLVLSLLLYVYTNLHQANSMREKSTDQDTADRSEKNRTPPDPELSFTDWFIMRRAERKINVTKLMLEYSLICPVSYSCGVDFGSQFLLDLSINNDCSRCTCEYKCVKRDTCCPGTHYGYVDHECVNTLLYPKDEKLFYSMVGKCKEMYKENQTIIEMCETEIDPCTSVESKLVYKNQHCALCNEETNCMPWAIKLECKNFMGFERSMSLFTSITEMHKALDDFECRVQFSVETSVKPPGCFGEDYKHDVLVNKCNVTGLWMVYDEDIEWACENFVNPYKDFRNVYCYICNPSRANEQNVALIGENILPKCNPKLRILHEACKTFPASTRLAPFKNIYCYYACNKDQGILKDTAENMALKDISEKNDDTLRTKLSLGIVYSGEKKFAEMKEFVNELLKDFSRELTRSISPLRSGKTDFYSSHLPYLVSEYINVCGRETVCNSSTNNDTIIYGNPVCGECTCETDCAEFDNCCPEVLLQKQPYSCMGARMFPLVYKDMKNRTAGYYERMNATYRIIDICLNNDTEAELSKDCSSYQDTSDIFRNIPVTTDTDNTYKNMYCFICNSNTFDAVLQFQAFCDTYIEYTLFTDIRILIDNIKSHCHKISFVPIQGKSCVENYNLTIAASIGGEKYVRKKISPLYFEFKIFQIEEIDTKDSYKPVKRVYAACNETHKLHKTHKSLKHVCESNTINILALPEYRLENKVYKNFACFICNPDTDVIEMSQYNVTSECLLNDSVEWYVYNWGLEKLCDDAKLYPRWLPYKNLYCSECNLPPWQLVDVIVVATEIKSIPPYNYIFSISRTDFENLERASDKNYNTNCPDGTSYDHIWGSCQILYCSGGFQLVNKSCKPILESASKRLYNIAFFLKYQNEEDTKNTGVIKTPLIVKLKDICTRVVGLITKTVEPKTAHFIQSGHCTTYSCLPQTLTPNSINDNMYIDITKTTVINVFFSIAINNTNKISAVHKTLLKALNQSYAITNISDINETPRSFRLYSYISLVASSFAHFCVFRYSPVLISEAAANYSQYSVDKYLTCPHLRLNLSETIMNDRTAELYHKKYDVTFKINEYKIQGKYAIICLSDFSKKSPITKLIHDKHPLDSTLKSFTFACSIFSLVCLFITFITYCIFPSLRTIPGKNIMTLCFFLFCSECFLQFGIGLANETKLCIAIGMCNHFCWLASFCVMNVCSFHMFKLFCLHSFTSSVASNLQQKRRFLKYLFYITCLPLILVLVTVSVSLTLYENIGYGKHYCFISDFYIFIGTFFIPACLIFVSNIIFFAIAFHKIRLTPTVQSNQNRNNYFVCLRLCTIVGITWPLIIVDNVLSFTWFSFLVSGLNALQGCFIFFSFVGNKKVYSLVVSSIRHKFLKHSASTERSGTELTD